MIIPLPAGYQSKHFQLYELVPPDVYQLIPSTYPESVIWGLFDRELLYLIDNVREFVNCPCTVNTWKFGGDLAQCGFRNDATGAKLSQHRFGRAADLHVRLYDALPDKQRINAYNTLRRTLMAMPAFGSATFEQNSDQYPDGIPWLHIDVRNNLTDSRLVKG